MPGVERKRLGLLQVELSLGEPRVGTAYAITDRMLVTARHVWMGESGAAPPVSGTARLMDGPGEWRRVRCVWNGPGGEAPDVDICLLELDQPVIAQSQRLGHYDGTRSMAWEGNGFARAAEKGPEGFRELAGLRGTLYALGALRQDVLELGVENPPASNEDWKGLSGAPVFVEGALVGVVQRALFRGGRLYATPIRRLLDHEGARTRLGPLRLEQVPAGALRLEEPLGLAHALPRTLLHPRERVIPFDRQIRAMELAALEKWMATGDAQSLWLVTGPGGAGKTRLLIETCESRRALGWQAGFLPNGASEETLRKVVSDGRPTLVCLDYAELRPRLQWELEALFAMRQPLRVVLLARGASDWWGALLKQMDTVEELARRTEPMAVLPVDLVGGERRRVATEAATAFAAVRRQDAARALSALTGETFEGPEFGRALYLHMAALAAVDGVPFDEPEGLPSVLVKHEVSQWGKNLEGTSAHEARAWTLTLKRTVAAVTLRGGVETKEQAKGLVERLRDPDAGSSGAFHALLRDLLPGSGEPGAPDAWLDPLEPDLLGEALVADVLTHEDRELLGRAFTTGDDAERLKTGFTVLGRLSARKPEWARPWLHALLVGGTKVDPPTLAERATSAFEAALALAESYTDHDTALGTVLAEVLEKWLPAEKRSALARQMRERMPKKTLSMREVAAWAARESVAGAAGAERASALLELGNRLSELGQGQREAALEATREAADIYRKLAEANPAFKPELSKSLNNLGNRLSELGQREAALEATREAVNIRRTLAEAPAFKPDLATSLNSLGNRLSELGQREAALEAAREAVNIFRTLAETNPAFKPDLAGSLNNLGNRLGELDQRKAALEATRRAALEAVRISLTLAKARPAAFLPDLATSLNNVGNRLSELGQHEAAFDAEREAALEATREAADIYRTLVVVRPDAFKPDLATSLNNLGVRLSELGQRATALEATREAVNIRRTLAEARPDAFLPDLVKSLSNLGNRLI